MQLPDPRSSRAVLIGASKFDDFEDLPAVTNNVTALANCLIDDQIWGLHEDNVTQLVDRVRSEDILAAIDDAAQAAQDTLIVYYAGHGLLDPHSNLLLATKGTMQRRPYTAIAYDAVRSILIDSRAARRVVILDCCYSGRALGTMGGAARASDAVAQSADAEGTFVMAAAAENKTALAPPDETYTAFTGELVKLFEEGHPSAPALWDLESLYRTLREVLRSRGRPEPQKRDRNSVGQLCIAHNRAKVSLPRESRPPALEVGATLSDRYRLQRLIATGGMGQVWEAVDGRVGRRVAVKVLKAKFSSDLECVERFRVEARTVAMLNHPGVVSVYDYGETEIDGQGRTAYLVMELVDGEPLNSVIRRTGRLTIDDALNMLEQTGRALQVAHNAGLVHRDIRPGNILITPSGQVKLTDFGIAKAVDAAPVTQTGMVMGTAQYIAPEQALGRDATAASDVYSLAVVGYEALSGQRPFTGDGALTVAMKHIKETPPPLPADVPPNVRELIELTLTKDPETRYRGGGAFADAVAAVRSGRRPPHPHLAASRARTGKYAAWRLDPSADTIYGARCLDVLEVDGAAVTCLAFSPDGSWLASGGADSAVHLWDPIDGRYIDKLGSYRSSCLVFSPDGQRLAVGSDKVVRLWDHEQSTVITTLAGHASWVTCVAFSPDGSLIATGSSDATVRFWDALSGTEVPPTITAHRHDPSPGGYIGTVKSVAFSPEGGLVATSGSDATVSLWRAPTMGHVRSIPARPATPETPRSTGLVETVFSPDGQTLATASGGKVQFWDCATAQPSASHKTLVNPTGSMLGMAFSPDGRTLATGSNDNAVRLWNPFTGDLIIKRDGHTDTINALAFSPTHAMLATASQDGTIHVWTLAV